ncbi:MAG: MlaE family lipid ABC transporter permease subunit [Planctomycetes bacterium]|nr:MlaE family lipid ABC transporter permease subunit [Planctomycetota bacterium]
MADLHSIDVVADGQGTRLALAGDLSLQHGAALWRDLRQALARSGPIRIDLSGVERVDGGAACMLLDLRAQRERGGAATEITGGGEGVMRLLELYGCPSGQACYKEAPACEPVLEQLGRMTVAAMRDAQRELDFVGGLLRSAVAAVRAPATVYWQSLGSLMERAGADAFPIATIIGFLLGLVLALQSSALLSTYGTDVLVADLVGLTVAKELGPLMTAIVVAGRSGAAYSAELGSMKVNEEIDALRVLGQDPLRFLVFPRVVALAAMMPLLTLWTDLMAMVGGMVGAVVKLDVTAFLYWHEMARNMDLADVFGGVFKSVFFGVAVALVACQRGLATREGAVGVGRSTTSAVVTSLLVLVLIDAVFAWVYSMVGM